MEILQAHPHYFLHFCFLDLYANLLLGLLPEIPL